jgi:hypothetical protein
MENLIFIVNSLTISIAFPSYKKLIFWGNRPLEKIIILDMLELTLSFQILQYSQKLFSCRSDAESENTKAFDTVWRKGLWHKLLGNEVNGQMYKVIFNMYSGIKSHKRHIGTSYCGKRFWTHQIPTSCLPILLICIHIEQSKNASHNMTLVTKYQISAINSY